MPKLGDGLSGLNACMSYAKTLTRACIHIRPNSPSPNFGIYVGGSPTYMPKLGDGLLGLDACMSYVC